MAASGQSTTAHFYESFTQRERDILTCLANGLSNREIASQLHLALQTIKWYNTQLYEKLNVTNRREAVAKAEGLGLLVTPESPSPKHNLPVQITPFIGRVDEVNQFSALLNDPGCRLLTIAGPGGIGKTRLAIQVAIETVGAFHDGVCWVALQSLSRSEYLMTTIAGALEVPLFEQTTPKDRLIDFLQDKQLLLILDNFEHLLDSAPLLTEILEAAPLVKILTTSRAALNLQAEWIRWLKGMAYPERLSNVETSEAFSALQFFAECARRVRPDFSLSADLSSAVRLCQLVEGTPLAIELAATWLKTLPCSDIVREIQRNLDFLETSARDVPARHRSMQAAFEHSWALLTPQEQTVFKKLSVFRGGFQREAAEQIAEASLRTLSALVDQSLLRLNADGRYEIHELLRQYAEAKLQETPDFAREVQDRHCDFYAGFLDAHAQALRSPAEMQAMETLTAEIGNVRLAWHWAVANRRYAALASAADSFGYLHFGKVWYQDGAEAIDAAIDALRAAEHLENNGITLGMLLGYQSYFCLYAGQIREANERARESLVVFRRHGAEKASAFSLHGLAALRAMIGQFEQARANAEEGLVIARTYNDFWWQARLLGVLGDINGMLGEYQTAQAQIRDSIALCKRYCGEQAQAWSLRLMGEPLRLLGKYEEARQYASEALMIARLSHSPSNTVMALLDLGCTLLAQGDYERAQAYFHEISDYPGMSKTHWFIAATFRLAEIARLEGRDDEAYQLAQVGLPLIRENGNYRTMIQALRCAGQIAARIGAYEDARSLLLEALEMARTSGYKTEIMRLTGALALVSSNAEAARRYFHEALTTGNQIKTPAATLEILANVAEDLVQRGQNERAFEVLMLCQHHSASTRETRDRAALLLANLEDADLRLKAQARGSTLSLDDTIGHLAGYYAGE